METTTTDQWIWQECLEVSISGNTSLNGSPIPGSRNPLHHHVANGDYVTFDDVTYEPYGSFSYKAIIAAPTKAEAADGATAVLVCYEDTTIPNITQPDGSTTSYNFPAEIAIRYIDSQGRLSFQVNASHIPGSAPFTKMQKIADVPCRIP